MVRMWNRFAARGDKADRSWQVELAFRPASRHFIYRSEPAFNRRHKDCCETCSAPLLAMASDQVVGHVRLNRIRRGRLLNFFRTEHGNHYLADSAEGRAGLMALLRFGLQDDTAAESAPWLEPGELRKLRRAARSVRLAMRDRRHDRPHLRPTGGRSSCGSRCRATRRRKSSGGSRATERRRTPKSAGAANDRRKSRDWKRDWKR